ncbi:MAG: zinc-ribbon domain-containing protein [Planctomycetes bacterium]|nr:zinc-ribbon domain-containing protein [Planctomycetota bacterium]
MFCANCGSKIEEGSKFCHHCGANVSVDLPIAKKSKKTEQINKINVNTDNTRETVEEYQIRTNIKSKEEAKKYLNQLRALFWIVFLSMVVIRGLGEVESELVAILFIPYIGLLIYFIIFSVKVLKAEKLSAVNALWCILFAPFSWLYVYPLMANPLKIIIGEKEPPIRLNEAKKQ